MSKHGKDSLAPESSDQEQLHNAQGKSSPRVMAVASGGGHWVQLMRLSHILREHHTIFVTVNKAYQCDIEDSKLYTIVDATAWNKYKLLKQAFQLLLIMLRERPEVVISTGAAAGYFALRIAKLLGARTIWVDSIANVECMSRAGMKIGAHADLWLTQWPHLAQDSGPYYKGAVL
jgi:UDP-N-acetylglucosamine:LPS N-acetylglucosamine transferase